MSDSIISLYNNRENNSGPISFGGYMAPSAPDLQRAQTANNRWGFNTLNNISSSLYDYTIKPFTNLFTHQDSAGHTPIQNFVGGTNKDGSSYGGYGSDLLNFGLGAGQLWLGKKQYDLGKDQLSTQKQQFSDQFNASKQQYNTHIRNTANAAYALNPNRVDPDKYYEENKIA